MLCKKCGKRIEVGSRCCGKCGEKVVLSGVSVLEVSAKIAEQSTIKSVMPAPPIEPEPVETKRKNKMGRLLLVFGIILVVIAGSLVLLTRLVGTKESARSAPKPAAPAEQKQFVDEKDSALQHVIDAWEKTETFSVNQTVVASYTIESTNVLLETTTDTVVNAQLTRSDVVKTERETETKAQYYTDSTSGFHNLYMEKDGVWSTQAIEGNLPKNVIGIGEKEVILQYLTDMTVEQEEHSEAGTKLSGTLNAESIEVVLSRLCPKLIEEYKKTDQSEDAVARLLKELPGVKIKLILEKDSFLPISLELNAEDTVFVLANKLNGADMQGENVTDKNKITIQLTYQTGITVELPVEADQAENAEIVRKDKE